MIVNNNHDIDETSTNNDENINNDSNNGNDNNITSIFALFIYSKTLIGKTPISY